MNTPGFTAHNSLYHSDRHYIAGLNSSWSPSATVVPLFRAPIKFPQGDEGDCHETCGPCLGNCMKSCTNSCYSDASPYPKACCLSTETCCSGKCFNTTSDAKNCGACDHSCPSGQVCNHGECGCRSALTLCNGKCVDLNSDRRNCGACGHDCSELYCIDGKCRCPSGLTQCGDTCTDLYIDKYNCGACGASCNGEECCVGTCGGIPCGSEYGCCPKGQPCCHTAVGIRCCSHACINVPFVSKDICI